jgi:hypothetical protein
LVDVLGANLHHRLLALENGRHQSRLADDPGGSTAANAERCAVMNGTLDTTTASHGRALQALIGRQSSGSKDHPLFLVISLLITVSLE